MRNPLRMGMKCIQGLQLLKPELLVEDFLLRMGNTAPISILLNATLVALTISNRSNSYKGLKWNKRQGPLA